MVIAVPFDGSKLSESALLRATEIRTDERETIVAVTAIPNNNIRYAQSRGWLAANESFHPQAIVEQLSNHVKRIDPNIEFNYLVCGERSQSGTIATTIRKFVKQLDARAVVVGSTNAGHIVSSLMSVGSKVAAHAMYDVYIIRTPHPDLDADT